MNCEYVYHHFANTVFKSVFFACLGVTTEVCFVAVSDYLHIAEDCSSGHLFKGHSYLWVIPLYASIPLLSPFFRKMTSDISCVQRYVLAGFIILAGEFIAGMFLKLILGQCPWEYTDGPHVLGFIRLDYWPLWIAFSAIADHVDVNIHMTHKNMILRSYTPTSGTRARSDWIRHIENERSRYESLKRLYY